MSINHSEQCTQKKVTCDNPKGLLKKSSGVHDLHYMQWGDENASKTAICVHGLTHNSRDFDFLACKLVAQGYRVICPDIVGRGKSDYLKNYKWYGYPLYVADMISLLAQLKLSNIDWIGTSMGGLIGLMLEAAMPHVINKMVINDIGVFIPKEALNRIGEYVGQSHEFPSREVALQYLKLNHEGSKEIADHHWQHMMEHRFTYNDDGSCEFAYDKKIDHIFRKKSGKKKTLPNINLWNMWKVIHCPTLIIRGAETDLLPKDVALKMAERGNVDLIELEGVAHAPLLMDDSEIEIVANWLQK